MIWVMANAKQFEWFNGINLRAGRFAAFARYFSQLPSVPRPRSLRSRFADGTFIIFVQLSRCAFILGGIVGASCAGTKTKVKCVILGLVIGAIAGFWIRRSLALRGRNPTSGFYLRMRERGDGDSPKLLESLLEWIRGAKPTALRCRNVTAAYAAAQRELQTCFSAAERARILSQLHAQTNAMFYGDQAVTCHSALEPQAGSLRTFSTQTASSIIPIGRTSRLRSPAANRPCLWPHSRC